jgi:hypothetical protein
MNCLAVLVYFKPETFYFFLETQLPLLEFRQHYVVRVRAMLFIPDLQIEFVMLIRELLDMRL